MKNIESGFLLCLLSLLFSVGIVSCSDSDNDDSSTNSSITSEETEADSADVALVGSMNESFPDSVHGNPLIPKLEQSLRDAGLVNVQEVDPSVRVALAYSTTDNFLNADVYGDLVRCYLQREVAEMVGIASQCVQQKDSSLRLIIFDGVRPRSV